MSPNHETTRLPLVLAGLVALSGGCTTTPAGGEACAAAADHVAACLGDLPAGLLDGCRPEGATELLALECDELRDAVGSGRADGFGLGLEVDDACYFNFQCEEDLVCRPDDERFGFIGKRCRSAGAFRDLCDDSDDCGTGLVCIVQMGWYHGRCLTPFRSTDQETVCAALPGRLEECGIQVPEGLLDDCLGAVNYDRVVEALDLECGILGEAVEAGLDLGDGVLFLGLGPNAECVFNFQCGGELVCRPTATTGRDYTACSDFFCLGNQFCALPGEEDELCDSDGDCASGLVCRYEELHSNGFCTPRRTS